MTTVPAADEELLDYDEEAADTTAADTTNVATQTDVPTSGVGTQTTLQGGIWATVDQELISAVTSAVKSVSSLNKKHKAERSEEIESLQLKVTSLKAEVKDAKAQKKVLKQELRTLKTQHQSAIHAAELEIKDHEIQRAAAVSAHKAAEKATDRVHRTSIATTHAHNGGGSSDAYQVQPHYPHYLQQQQQFYQGAPPRHIPVPVLLPQPPPPSEPRIWEESEYHPSRYD